MTALALRDQAGRPIAFGAERMVNLGYVGRDRRAVQAHIDELSRAGVPPPPSVPLFIPLPLHTLTMDTGIQVVGSDTSGEAEVVFLIDRERILIGVGSDHTDRALERTSIGLSKAVCPNVLGPEVWDFREVEDGWDDLVLRSFVRRRGDEPEIAYQRAPLGTLLPARTLIDVASARLGTGDARGLVLYSGTIPILTHGFVHGGSFRCELVDERRGRTLSCAYDVVRIASAYDALLAMTG